MKMMMVMSVKAFVVDVHCSPMVMEAIMMYRMLYWNLPIDQFATVFDLAETVCD